MALASRAVPSMLFLPDDFQVGVLKRRCACLHKGERRLNSPQRCMNRSNIEWKPKLWRLCKWEMETREFVAQCVAVLRINQQVFFYQLSFDLRRHATSNDLPFIKNTDAICLFGLF